MKIHLDIRDDISPTVALWCVLEVVKDGRVSDGGNCRFCAERRKQELKELVEQLKEK